MRMSSPSLPQCATHFSDGTGLVSRSGPLAEQRCVVCALLKTCNQLNEIKALGAKQSTQRTAEQTAMARFWEARVPTIYLPVVRSVATAPGRELT